MFAVMVDDFHVNGPRIRPHKANSIFVIHAMDDSLE